MRGGGGGIGGAIDRESSSSKAGGGSGRLSAAGGTTVLSGGGAAAPVQQIRLAQAALSAPAATAKPLRIPGLRIARPRRPHRPDCAASARQRSRAVFDGRRGGRRRCGERFGDIGRRFRPWAGTESGSAQAPRARWRRLEHLRRPAGLSERHAPPASRRGAASGRPRRRWRRRSCRRPQPWFPRRSGYCRS